MYYRISTYKIRPGLENKLIEIGDRLRPEMEAIPGIIHILAVRFAEDTYMTVAVYDSAEAAEAATDTARSIWARMADCIDIDTLTQQAGEVIWEL